MVTLLFKLPQVNIPCLDQAGEEEEVLFDAAADVKDVNGQGLKDVNWVMSSQYSTGKILKKNEKDVVPVWSLPISRSFSSQDSAAPGSQMTQMETEKANCGNEKVQETSAKAYHPPLPHTLPEKDWDEFLAARPRERCSPAWRKGSLIFIARPWQHIMERSNENELQISGL